MAVVLTERIKTELMNCHDIVATGRYPYTGRLGILTKRDEELVEEAMEAVHAQELGNQDFNAISDGQRQRVLLARAICQEPEILILDEPTSFLDVKHKLELLAILEKMAREKKMTVIMSLHEIDLAQKVSDKIVCVQGENISHFGKPEEVFQEEIIRDLYGITNGSFDPRFGSIELPGIKGEPEVLVIADAEQIKRVVNNIVSNSLKYTDAGRQRRINLRVKDVGDFIQVEIEDNGKGIAAKD